MPYKGAEVSPSCAVFTVWAVKKNASCPQEKQIGCERATIGQIGAVAARLRSKSMPQTRAEDSISSRVAMQHAWHLPGVRECGVKCLYRACYLKGCFSLLSDSTATRTPQILHRESAAFKVSTTLLHFFPAKPTPALSCPTAPVPLQPQAQPSSQSALAHCTLPTLQHCTLLLRAHSSEYLAGLSHTIPWMQCCHPAPHTATTTTEPQPWGSAATAMRSTGPGACVGRVEPSLLCWQWELKQNFSFLMTLQGGANPFWGCFAPTMSSLLCFPVASHKSKAQAQ